MKVCRVQLFLFSYFHSLAPFSHRQTWTMFSEYHLKCWPLRWLYAWVCICMTFILLHRVSLSALEGEKYGPVFIFCCTAHWDECVWIFLHYWLLNPSKQDIQRKPFYCSFSKCGLCCKSFWSGFLPVVLFLASVRPTGARQGANGAYFPCGQSLLWRVFVCLYALSLFLFSGPYVSG